MEHSPSGWGKSHLRIVLCREKERGDGKAFTYTCQPGVDPKKNLGGVHLGHDGVAIRQGPLKDEGTIFACTWVVSIVSLLTTR